LESKGVFEPQFPQTESGLFNQTVYEAKSNLSDFIAAFKNKLLMEKELLKTISNFSTGWTTYGPEIYDKVKKLKPEFDTITDYREKLQFLVKNDLSLQSRTYPTTADIEQQKLPENKISVEPQTDEQIITFNQFFFHWFIAYSTLGFGQRKKDYYQRIENGANSTELTKTLISDIGILYKKDKESSLQDDFKLYSLGYDRSSLYGDKEKFFDHPKIYPLLSLFCQGYSDEVFKRFLEHKLKKLELPEAPSVTLPKVFDLGDFKKFLVAVVDVVLKNADFDLIKWQDHFSKEAWSRVSFYANGEMKTANESWMKHREHIIHCGNESKEKIEHLIVVEGKRDVMLHVKNEINKLYAKAEKFKDDNNMFNADIWSKNPWFFELWNVVVGFRSWFNELIKTLEIEPRNSNQSDNLKLIENLDKLVDAFKGFIVDCELSFGADLKSSNRILNDSNVTFADEAYDLTTIAFQDIKTLMSTQNPNAKGLVNYYYTKTKELLVAVDRQIKDYELDHSKNVLNTSCYFDTILWLGEFSKDLAPFVKDVESSGGDMLPKSAKSNEKQIKDFFNDDVALETVLKIQGVCSGLRGKKMAIAIHLLQSNLKIVNIANQKRKEFVRALIEAEPEAKDMASINKNFTQYSDDIKIVPTKDGDYISIKETIQKLLLKKSC
jgi:hypothetical protein